jgi:hypothetical protein
MTGGFSLATAGCCVTALATRTESTPLVILGLPPSVLRAASRY